MPRQSSRPILLATNGSPPAQLATCAAVELARALETSVVAFAVGHLEPPVRPYFGYQADLARLGREEAVNVLRVAKDAAAAVKSAGVHCAPLTGTGPVAAEICAAARAIKARVIVVGAATNGHTSVVDGVACAAPCPVLVVRNFTKGGIMKPILLATDGSPSADGATREAIDLARAFGAKLIVASVEQTVLPAYGAYYGYTEIAADFRDTEAKHVAHTLAEAKGRATAAGVECETVALGVGPVGEEICHLARERNPRLVVVGAHGWGRLGRLLHGSVSTHVLHHSPCPVLVVLGEEPDQPEGITTLNGSTGKPIARRVSRG